MPYPISHQLVGDVIGMEKSDDSEQIRVGGNGGNSFAVLPFR